MRAYIIDTDLSEELYCAIEPHIVGEVLDAPPKGTFQVSHNYGSTFSPPVKIQGEQDSREELEADVHDLFWGDNLQRYARQKGYLDGSGIDVNESITTTNHEGHVTATTVMHLLDRQKAITERHWMEIVGASANANVELKRQIDEWQARVDELTEQLEAAHAKNRSLKAHIAKMQEGRHGWHVKSAELQKQVDELIAENAKLSSELTAARNAHAQAEHEAVILREKLGRMLDNAHEITRIGGDC